MGIGVGIAVGERVGASVVVVKSGDMKGAFVFIGGEGAGGKVLGAAVMEGAFVLIGGEGAGTKVSGAAVGDAGSDGGEGPANTGDNVGEDVGLKVESNVSPTRHNESVGIRPNALHTQNNLCYIPSFPAIYDDADDGRKRIPAVAATTTAIRNRQTSAV